MPLLFPAVLVAAPLALTAVRRSPFLQLAAGSLGMLYVLAGVTISPVWTLLFLSVRLRGARIRVRKTV